MHPLMQAEGLSLTEAYQRVCRDVPLRRPASPEEIAEACQFSVHRRPPSSAALRWSPTAGPVSSMFPLWRLPNALLCSGAPMTSEAVFIRSARWPMVLRRTVTCWLPPACPQAKTLPFMSPGASRSSWLSKMSRRCWNGKRAPAGDRPAPGHSVYRLP